MVVICLPDASASVTPQERVATPSTCTVQAPHWAMPQPYLVPVRPTCSRMTHNSGVLGSAFTSCTVPLIVRRAILSSRERGHLGIARLGKSGRRAARKHPPPVVRRDASYAVLRGSRVRSRNRDERVFRGRPAGLGGQATARYGRASQACRAWPHNRAGLVCPRGEPWGAGAGFHMDEQHLNYWVDRFEKLITSILIVMMAAVIALGTGGLGWILIK